MDCPPRQLRHPNLQRAVVRIRDISDSDVVSAAPAYQTAATDTDSPDAWTQIVSNWADGTTPDRYNRDASPSVAGKYYIRFGVLIKNTVGTDGDWKRAQVTALFSGRD